MKELKGMSLKELKSLRAKIDSLIDLEDAENFDGEEMFMYKIIIDTINKKLSYKIYPLNPDKRLHKDVTTAYEFIKGFLLTNLKECDRIMLVRYYELFTELTIVYLKEINIPISITTVIKFHKMFPALIERDFPSYLESGLLDKVI